jgi:N-acetylglucosamine kinase-like BadF-type ATPase
LVARAAAEGDSGSRRLFEQAAQELGAMVHAVRDQLEVPLQTPLPVSYSGGMFRLEGLLQPMLETALKSGDRSYEFVKPRLAPVAGAALYAAKLAGAPLSAGSVCVLSCSLDGGALKDSA